MGPGDEESVPCMEHCVGKHLPLGSLSEEQQRTVGAGWLNPLGCRALAVGPWRPTDPRSSPVRAMLSLAGLAAVSRVEQTQKPEKAKGC